MESKKTIWNEEKYQLFLTELQKQENKKYRDFHSRLTTTRYPILGINVPKCRKIAKQIIKTDIPSFLKQTKDNYYEEVLIEGFVIASIKEEELFFPTLEQYLPKIDNWAICDSFCNSVQIVSENSKKYLPYWLSLLKQKEPFTIRMGLIILLSFYIEEQYLSTIFQAIDNIKSNHYYVNMGCAWLLAEMYITFPELTEEYLKKAKIDDFTINKAISKIRDSYRVTKEQKDEMLKYKRRTKK